MYRYDAEDARTEARAIEAEQAAQVRRTTIATEAIERAQAVRCLKLERDAIRGRDAKAKAAKRSKMT